MLSRALVRIALWLTAGLAGVPFVVWAVTSPLDTDPVWTYAAFIGGGAAIVVGLLGAISDFANWRRRPEPRHVISASPEVLVGFHIDHVSVQAQVLLKPYLGKWLHLEGRVRNLDEAGTSLMLTRQTATGEVPVTMFFNRRWRGRLEVLRRGDSFDVEGKIDRVDPIGVTLRDCELVGLRTERESGSARASSTITPPAPELTASSSSAGVDLLQIGNAVRDFLAPPPPSGLPSKAPVAEPDGDLSAARARQDAANERRIVDATERIDRCSEIAAARIAYAAVWHRGGQWRPLKEERLRLERAHLTDVPDQVLDGTDEWEAYLATERVLRHNTTTPREDRAKQIEKAGAAVLRRLTRMRAETRA